jgi:hypothetical protein
LLSWPVLGEGLKMILCTGASVLYDCSKLNNEREQLIAHISKEDNWPIRKSELVNKYLKQVIHYINSIDYEKL